MPNHRVDYPRKSLADQIDRLDHILDGLAEALNEAMADAVRQSVGSAAHRAVREVLAEQAVAGACASTLDSPRPTRTSKTHRTAPLRAGLVILSQGFVMGLRHLWRGRFLLLTLAATGLVAGVLSAAVGPTVAASLTGLTGFTLGLAARFAPVAPSKAQ